MRNLSKVIPTVGLLISVFTISAHADGLNATGDTLPIGAGGKTVLTITGSVKEADFLGPVTATTLGVTGAGAFGGPVGIGTTSPGNLLDIYSPTQANELLQSPTQSQIQLASPVNYIYMTDVTAGKNLKNFRLDSAGGNTTFRVMLDDLSGPAFTPITIQHSTGNIGIATTNPQAPLDVNGRISASTVTVTSTVSVGASCSPDGTIAQSNTTSGLLLSCQSGKWANAISSNNAARYTFLSWGGGNQIYQECDTATGDILKYWDDNTNPPYWLVAIPGPSGP